MSSAAPEPKRKFNIREGDEAIYTENSSTIFYYGSYRVVIVLDFSRSTALPDLYSNQTYSEKVMTTLEALLKVLNMRIENKLSFLKRKLVGGDGPQIGGG